MAQDFAKRKQSGKKAAPRKKKAPRQAANGNSFGKSLRLYGAGVLSGVFLSFLIYLGTLPSSENPLQETGKTAQPETPKPRFDFYTLLPKPTIDVDEDAPPVEPAADVRNPRATAQQEVYLLQTGSFRQRDDADRRRAELLLLGLAPNVEESNGDNGRWFRVYLGPFESHTTMARARSLTANQNIDTLLLKRNRP